MNSDSRDRKSRVPDISGRRILIAGCGRVGSALATQLRASGCEVWGLRRSTPDPVSQFQSIQADLSDRSSLDRLPAPLDFVFYLVSSDSSELTAYRQAHVDGLINLMAALSRLRIHFLRLFFSSSTGVYGQREGEWVDESSPTVPDYPQGQILLEGERIALSSNIPATVIRFAGLYGAGRNRLLERITAGTAVCSRQRHYVNHIHVDDCVGILYHLMSLDDPQSLYLAVDQEPVERCTFLTWLAEQMNAPVPQKVDLEKLGDRARRSNKRCSSRLIAESGYTFRYPDYRKGYRDLIRRFLD